MTRVELPPFEMMGSEDECLLCGSAVWSQAGRLPTAVAEKLRSLSRGQSQAWLRRWLHTAARAERPAACLHTHSLYLLGNATIWLHNAVASTNGSP